MKNQKFLRPALNGALLASAMVLLSGCGEWFKGKGECADCGTGADAGEVLLTLNGKPAITKGKLDKFFETYLANRPGGMYEAMDPKAKRKAFDELVMMEVMDQKIKKDGEDQKPENKAKYQAAADLARYTVNAEILGNKVLESIDTSPEAVKNFYNELRGKNPAFDNPPFLKTPAGIKLESVGFKDEKSAKDFLAKAQKAGANLASLAQAVGKAVNKHGMVTAQSKLDFALKAKAKTLESNAVELVPSAGQFVVVKAVGPRQEATYAEFDEVVKAQPGLEQQLANYMKQVKGQAKFVEEIEAWKKDLSAVVNDKFFEEEEARKKAELEAKFKELKEAQDKEAPAEAAKAAA